MTCPTDSAPRLGGVLFDFDGVIIDTETTRLQAWRNELARLAVTLDVAKYTYFTHQVRIGSHELLAAALLAVTDDPLTVRTLVDRARTESMRLANALQPLPGVLSLLSVLRSAGLRTAVVSNSPRSWIDHHLRRLALTGLFDTIVAGGDTKQGKPHPASYLRAVRELGLWPCQVIALEDSPIGIAAAVRAGLVCLAVPNPVTADLLHDRIGPTITSLDTATVAVLTDVLHQHRQTSTYNPDRSKARPGA